MDIIKRLSLNKTPKDIPNGSMVCAKNMMVDDTGSFLTNDIGFKLTHDFNGERIVGIIPCPDEIIIFTIETTGNSDGSHIYRKKDDGDVEEVLSKWYYSGGKISGTYSYNYKGELILVVAESGAQIDVPLKTFTIKDNTDTTTKNQYPYIVDEPDPYYVENVIPRYDCTKSIVPIGSLVCGVYTFFIRFKISTDNYTKFFQITGDINIVQNISTKKYTHRYVDEEDYLRQVFARTLTVNNNGISTKGIKLDIKFYEQYYRKFQLAYIIKRNSDIQCRIQNEYDLSPNVTINIANNEYISETSISNLLENPHQFFNVKEAINYNNRLYIANYKEYDNKNYYRIGGNIAVTTASVDSMTETELNRIKERHNAIANAPADKTKYDLTFDFKLESRSILSADFESRVIDTYYTNNVLIKDIYTTPVNMFGSVLEMMTTESTQKFWDIMSKTIYSRPLGNRDYYLDGTVYDRNAKWDCTNDGTHQTFLLTQRRGDSRFTQCIYKGGRTVHYIPIEWNRQKQEFNIPTDIDTTVLTDALFIGHDSDAPEDTYIYALRWISDNEFVEYRLFGKDANKLDMLTLWNKKHENYSVVMLGSLGFANDLEWKMYKDPVTNCGVVPDEIHITFKATEPSTQIVEEDEEEEPETPIEPDPEPEPEPGEDPIEDSDPTVIVPNDEDTLTKIVQTSSTTTGVGPNSRTLHPLQLYNLFIHYIRIDGSFTPGYSIGLVAYSVSSEGTLIIPYFGADRPTEGNFIGYFISYEDVERTVEQVLAVTTLTSTSGGGTKIKINGITNVEYIYDLDLFRGELLRFRGVGEKALTSSHFEYIEDRLNSNRVIPKVPFYNNLTTLSDRRGYFRRKIYPIYTKQAKTLYRLTKNIYDWDNFIGGNDYLPDYFDTQNIIHYSDFEKKLVIIPDGQHVYKHDGTDLDGTKTDYYVIYDIKEMYSKYPTSAMNIKQDIQEVAVTLNCKIPQGLINTLSGETEHTTLVSILTETPETKKERGPFINSVITPDKLHDYLELQACYRAKPSKSYTNFRDDNINIFDKTIYRSDVMSDESLVNGFRHFDTNNYKNITENKGKITNLVGIGLYLLVHTEYSLFVFDRTPKLTDKAQVNIPDTFDIDYQEVMPSNEGFGGLLDKDESILTKNGYVWFDRANKIIFCYENGKASILSGDIHNLLQYMTIKKMVFAEDIIHNRLIICITHSNNKYLTISYSFNTKSYISLHDYKFTNSYRTYNKSYVFDNSGTNRQLLYEFDNSAIADYQTLTYKNDYIFQYIQGEVVNTVKSYVDIIYNLDYEVSKVLESISYVLNEILEDIDTITITEQQLNRRFSGNIIKIYTDENDTGYLDVFTDEEADLIDVGDRSINKFVNVNKLNNYKYPYWAKGKWNLNYFRNCIDVRNEDDENKTDINNTRPDNLTAVFGKYFVVRFVFDNDRKIKLDNISFNVNPY